MFELSKTRIELHLKSHVGKAFKQMDWGVRMHVFRMFACLDFGRTTNQTKQNVFRWLRLDCNNLFFAYQNSRCDTVLNLRRRVAIVISTPQRHFRTFPTLGCEALEKVCTVTPNPLIHRRLSIPHALCHRAYKNVTLKIDVLLLHNASYP